MTKILWLAVLVPFLVAAPTLGSETTRVTHDCLHTRIQPRQIVFACADHGYYAKHLRWKSWMTSKARGRAVFHFNDCDPSCASGTFHRRRGMIHLRGRLWCDGPEKHVFERARMVYRRPWRGERVHKWRLGCPF